MFVTLALDGALPLTGAALLVMGAIGLRETPVSLEPLPGGACLVVRGVF